jgi:hypothetical protein
MPAQAGGFLHWRKERYIMNDATASWDGRDLDVYGKSDECAIYFCGIPFGPAEDLADIEGRSYSDEATTPFSEGRIAIAGNCMNMDGGEITCIGVSRGRDAVVLEFAVDVRLDITGRKRKVTGAMRCRVVPAITPDFSAYDF